MVHRVPRNGLDQDIGLALLGAGTAFGIWSATNTSPVGTVKFAIDRPDIAYRGMNVGLALILMMAAGIGLYYKKNGCVAAAVTGASGAGLWLWYNNLIQGELGALGKLPVTTLYA